MLTAPHLHAMVIHFPIALLMTGFLSEFIAILSKQPFFFKASFYLLALGTIGAIVAYVTGSYASDGMTDAFLANPLERHEVAALITLWLALTTLLFKTVLSIFEYQRTWIKWIFLVVFATLIGFVSRTGFLGGELVFKHGTGIELTLPDFRE